MLPMTLDLRDFHGVEKIADLSQRLTIAGAPGHHAPAAGDIAYYAPWGNLALFYGDAGMAAGLVPLGRFNAGTAPLRTATRIHLTLEKD
ncbi:hypothetical protein FGG78_26350 [Thioclava sp. BHET1]|nr:hypothetical protein FGG78_26350 [Thioclava sp. BHET1]